MHLEEVEKQSMVVGMKQGSLNVGRPTYKCSLCLLLTVMFYLKLRYAAITISLMLATPNEH